MKKGPFTVISSETKYKNPWITVTEDRIIKPDGKQGVFGTVDYGSGATIVALTKEKDIFLIKEYYYVLETEGIQIPSGGIDKGETPLEAAKRELIEEAGCVSNKWIELGMFQPFTMIIKSPEYLFLALNVGESKHLDPLVKPFKVPFLEAYQMVLDSKIQHGASVVAILKTKVWLDQHC